MNLDQEPNAEDVTKLWEHFKKKWDQQNILDDAMLEYAMLKNPADVAKQKDGGKQGVKGLRAGFGHTLVKERAQIMTVTPSVHVANPEPLNPKLEAHSSLLEAWLIAAMKRSQQAGNVDDKQKFDLALHGRYWDSVLPHPHLWADTDMEDLVKKMNDEDDEEKIKGYDSRIKRKKANVFPIRTVYVPPRGTYTTFAPEYWLPEVIEHRQMLCRDIRDRWGEDALPKPLRDNESEDGTTKTDILIWANWCYASVIIPHNEDPKIATKATYHHDFGRSPYGLCEADLAPDNDLGIRWLGVLYGARYQLDAIDEILSDWREQHRDNARNPRIFYIDPRMRRGQDDPLVSARGKTVDIKDGMVLFVGEKLELGPVPVLNEQTPQLLDRVMGLLNQTQIRDVLRGETLSGQSQNTVTTSLQIAERELSPSMRAIAAHHEDKAERHLLSVKSIGESVPIMGAIKGAKKDSLIEANPEDAEWAFAVQCGASNAIPIDGNLEAAQAERWLKMGISKDTTFTGVLHIEDPQGEDDKSHQEMMQAAAWEQVIIPAAIQKLQSAGNQITPEQAMQIQQLLQSASPDLVAFLNGEQPQPTNGATPGGGTEAGNMRREAIPQTPQGAGLPPGGVGG